MKYSKKTCVHNKVVVAMNADKEKYLNYETSANCDLIGKVCVRCHASKELNFFGVKFPRKFKCYRGRYARVTFPEKLVLKENANRKLLVDDEGQLPTDGKMLPVDRSYYHPPTITIQRKVKGGHIYPHNVMQPILSRCRNCCLWKNIVVIDREIASKLKWALADIICKEIKDELMKNKPHASTNGNLPTDTFIEP